MPEEANNSFDPRKWTLKAKILFIVNVVLSINTIIFVALFISRPNDEKKDVLKSFLHSQVAGNIRAATCAITPDMTQSPNLKPDLTGTIRFYQVNGAPMKVNISITGLLPLVGFNRTIGIGLHIHTYGAVGDCSKAGGHYNPEGVNHRGWTGFHDSHDRHPGDFGNSPVDVNGAITRVFVESKATLFGTQSILGRAIVLHEGSDDLGLVDNDGSRSNGNAGARVGCCVIGHQDAAFSVPGLPESLTGILF